MARESPDRPEPRYRFPRRAVRRTLDVLVLLGVLSLVVVALGGVDFRVSLTSAANPCFFLAAVLLCRGILVSQKARRHRLRIALHTGIAFCFLLGGLAAAESTVISLVRAVPRRLMASRPAAPVDYTMPLVEGMRAPKNLILLTLDTLRADHLGSYGFGPPVSPHLDRLAGAAVRMDNAVVPMPATVPSHAAILTGKYPWNSGAVSNAHSLPPETVTLAERLRSEGFLTGGFVSCSLLQARRGFARGFDVFVDTMEGDAAYQVPASVRVDDALEWLRTVPAGRPFAVWIHLFDPHAPYEAPDSFDDRFRPILGIRPDTSLRRLDRIFLKKTPLSASELHSMRASYDAEIAFMDHEVGRVLSWLTASPFAKDTLVVATADHGEELYEHDFFFQHNLSLYQGVIRVPVLVWHASLNSRGMVVPEPVESVDLYPTMLDLLEVPHEEDALDGRSFAAALEAGRTFHGRKVQVARREITGAFQPAWTVIKGGLKYIRFGNPAREDELYNLLEDPGETRNLLEDHPVAAEWMRSVLEARFDLAVPGDSADAPGMTTETEEALRGLGYLR